MTKIKSFGLIATGCALSCVAGLSAVACGSGTHEEEEIQGVVHSFLKNGEFVKWTPSFEYEGEAEDFHTEPDVYNRYMADAATNYDILADDFITYQNQLWENYYNSVVTVGGTVSTVEAFIVVDEITFSDNIYKLSAHTKSTFKAEIPLVGQITMGFDVEFQHVYIGHSIRSFLEENVRTVECDYSTGTHKDYLNLTDWSIKGSAQMEGDDEPVTGNFNYTNWDAGEGTIDTILGKLFWGAQIQNPHYMSKVPVKYV